MKHNNHTLVILSPGFPENEKDTTCLPAQQLFVKTLKNNFPSLNIIILSFQYPFTVAGYEWNGIRVIPFNSYNKGKVNKLQTWWGAWQTLKKIEKENTVIGLFSFWCGECALVGKWFGKQYNVPHYIWILGQDARKQNQYIRLIRPLPQQLVAMSGFLAKEFSRNHGILPQHIIPNSIDPTIFPREQPIKNIDIIGAGSLIALKQYDVFIRIIKELSLHLPNIKAIICGKGPEENNLRALISQLQLEQHIELYGEVTHLQVLALMQRSKILLHPSNYEGFSTVCLEALYAGAHVVSFCDPLNINTPNWHIAATEADMLQKTLDVLANPTTQYKPVAMYTMSDTAKSVMRLFNYSEPATSPILRAIASKER
jgi:glycosyltransferase involved in cell wall biosynthesis